MNLKQIEIFNAIMTTGSISGAAKLLYISVPAVSQALSHTENRLGFLLFKRYKNRLYPTAEAQILASKADSISRDLVEVVKLCEDLKFRKEGFINIVSSIGLGQLIIPKAINNFHKKHSQIHIRYENLRYEPIRESLLKQNADFGISVLPIKHPNLKLTALAQGDLYIACSKSHPLSHHQSITIKDIAPYEIIGYPIVTPWGEKIRGLFEKNGCSPQISIEVGTPQNAFSIVRSGIGVSIVDEFSVMAYKHNDLAMISISGEDPLIANLVHLQTQPLTQNAQSFIAILKEVINEFDLEPATIYR